MTISHLYNLRTEDAPTATLDECHVPGGAIWYVAVRDSHCTAAVVVAINLISKFTVAAVCSRQT